MTSNQPDTPAAAASPEVFRQLGLITRQLHDSLNQLGVVPALTESGDVRADTRDRLNYVVSKFGEAAEKVLNSVDRAKLEQSNLAQASQRWLHAIESDPAQAVADGALKAYADSMAAASERIDGHLTDIMMAQDFHDLTGQVVAKVVALALDLEHSLVELLLKAAPGELTAPENAARPGSGADAKGRFDSVKNQGEVDDLLASLGF